MVIGSIVLWGSNKDGLENRRPFLIIHSNVEI